MPTPSFASEVKVDGSLATWLISGTLDGSQVAPLKGDLAQLLDHGCNQLILNFESLQAIDSRGIAFLISTQKSIRENDGRLVLVNLNAQFAGLLEMTKLNRVFEIFMDLDTARKSFGSGETEESA